MGLSADQIITIGASISGSTILGAFISFFHTKKIARIQHEYEYKKVIINKRLEAYGIVERVLNQFLTSTRIDENMIHMPFTSDENFIRMNLMMMEANTMTYWLNDATERKFDEFKHILAKFNYNRPSSTDEELIKFGIENYHQLATLRTDVHQLIKTDYSNLYDLKKIKGKQISNGFYTAEQLKS